jgi:hypothetical protein
VSPSSPWIWTSGSPTTNIPLTGSFVLVKGSFTATVNGNPLSNVPVLGSAFKESSLNSGEFNAGLLGSWYYEWAGTTCTWTFNMEALASPAQVRFSAEIGGYPVTETVTLGASNITIPFRGYTFTASPIAGMVTIGGTPLAGGTLMVFSQPVTTFSDLNSNQPPLSSAQITNGSFSGYVPDGLSSGYVVIDSSPMASPLPDSLRYSPSPVALTTSMVLDYSTLIPLTE